MLLRRLVPHSNPHLESDSFLCFLGLAMAGFRFLHRVAVQMLLWSLWNSFPDGNIGNKTEDKNPEDSIHCIGTSELESIHVMSWSIILPPAQLWFANVVARWGKTTTKTFQAPHESQGAPNCVYCLNSFIWWFQLCFNVLPSVPL